MNNYAYLVKAKAKTEKKNMFCWISAKSDSRADRDIMNILEDEEISTGRNGDYNLPIRTDWLVVDDLPEEGKLDDTWCDRYELNDDGKSWRQIIAAGSEQANTQKSDANVAGGQSQSGAQSSTEPDNTGTLSIEQATFAQRVLGSWMYGPFEKLFHGQQVEIHALQHDMDATFPQNLLLALNNAKDLLQLQHCHAETLFDLIDSIKSIWSPDGKAPDVGNLVTFSKEWIGAHNTQSTAPNGPFREDITAKWINKQGMQRTESGANAGGNVITDRDPNYKHTLDTLDVEIAMATLPFDFDIYEVPGPTHRRAKEIVVNNEEPFKTWSKKLRNSPGILDYSRAAIFALIRGASPDITHFPDSMQRYINANLTESDHAKPTPEILKLARQVNSAAVVLSEIDKARAGEPSGHGVVLSTEFQAIGNALVEEVKNTQHPAPEIKNLGDGKFSIDGMLPPASNEGEKTENQPEGGDDVQMEAANSEQIETGIAVSQDEKNDAEQSAPVAEGGESLERRVIALEKVIFHLNALLAAVQSVNLQAETTDGERHG